MSLVETKALRNATQGSYEHSIARARLAVEGRGDQGRIIGTFSDHVVLLTDAGELVEVPFQVAEGGTLVLMEGRVSGKLALYETPQDFSVAQAVHALTRSRSGNGTQHGTTTGASR